MKTTEYLYGIDAHILTDMPYKQALEYKIESAKALQLMLNRQARKVLKIPQEYDPLLKRWTDADKAVEFNNKLLQELAPSSERGQE